MRLRFSTTGIVAIIFAVLFGAAAGFGAYTHVTLSEKIAGLQARLASSTDRVATLETRLAEQKQRNTDLANRYREKKQEVEGFKEQIENITGEVATLTKLKDTDEELLKKYSRTYFLNEHYRPSALDLIEREWRSPEDEAEEIHEQVKPYLMEMLEDAEDDGVDLLVASGYRSFDTQREVHDGYTRTYGSGANTFSAVQGYSEHQLGTTVDLTTPAQNGAVSGFEETEAYEWLRENAHEYGFILSYPKNNQYYQFEPWHWRFVGIKLADELDGRDMHFYDMPQREIDEYLVHLFEGDV